MAADVAPFQFFLAALAGWLSRHLQDVIAYLVEENRVLRANHAIVIQHTHSPQRGWYPKSGSQIN